MTLAKRLRSKNSAAAGPAVFDDFTGANGSMVGRTPTIGSGTWAKTGGALTIASNQAKIGAYDPAKAFIESGLADGTVQIDVAAASGTRGLVFRYVDASNYWRVDFSGVGSNVFIKKILAGVTTDFARGTLPAGSNPRTVKVVLLGNSISLFFEAAQQGASVTDSDLATATKHGFHTDGFFEPEVLFDNFQVA